VDNKERRSSTNVTSLMIEIANKECKLTHDGGVPYATVTIPVRRTVRIDGSQFKQWISHQLYTAHNIAPSDTTLTEGVRLIAASARFKGEEKPVHVRIAGVAKGLYIDLGDEQQTVVLVSRHRWTVVEEPNVLFRRPTGIEQIPRPTAGNVDMLRPFINCCDETFVLIVGWLIAAMRPSGPYPILLLTGEQGSAKSTTARILRSLIDPNAAALRSIPKNEQDLAIACSNSRVQAFDNLSDVKPWLSDALCRIATGGGFAARTHYTNDEETLFDFQRPIIITSIADVASRSDLLDRSIMVRLNQISENSRKTEAEINAAFDDAKPAILGGILDAVSSAFRHLDDTHLDILPRMADAAVWVQAAEHALPWDVGEFNDLYLQNRDQIDAMALESDLLAIAVMALIEKVHAFSGNATELAQVLTQHVSLGKEKYLPSNRNIKDKLTRLAPNLRRHAGIDVNTSGRSSTSRTIEISKVLDNDDDNDDVIPTLPPTNASVDDSNDNGDDLSKTMEWRI